MNPKKKDSFLSLETATPVCSIAILLPDGKIIERRESGQGIHSEMTFVFIQELLDESGIHPADLNGIIISAGPGSYTGLRIGLSAAIGMVFQSDIPVFKVNTLESIREMTALTYPGKRIHSIVDARRKHVYYLPPDALEVQTIEIDLLADKLSKGDILAGTGIDRFPEASVTGVQLIGNEVISARGGIHLFNTGRAVLADADEAEPDYHPQNDG